MDVEELFVKMKTRNPEILIQNQFIYWWLLALLIIALPVNIHGLKNKNVRFEHFSLKQGLSQVSVNCILQDNKGFMWFGTQDGLNRFDGYTFKVFKRDPDNPNSLSHNYVRTMIKDKSGNLWIGTDAGGLDKYNPGTGIFNHYHHDPNDPTSLSHYCVNALFEDSSGNLWVGTYRNGLNRLNRKSGTFIHYIHQPENSNTISSNVIYAICESPPSYLWIGTTNGLDSFDPKTGTFKHHLGEFINCLWPDQQHKYIIWIGTESNGLYQIDTNTGSIKHYPYDAKNPDGISHPTINTIFQDHTGTLWIGTEGGGLNKFDDQSKTFSHYVYNPQNPQSLNSNSVYSIFQDQGHILWIGTSGGGINKLDPRTTAFHNYSHVPGNPNSLSTNSVGEIYEDRDGILWIGTDDGLNRYDSNTDTYKHYKHDPENPASISNNYVNSIEKDSLEPGILWVGTSKGLNRFNIKEEKFHHPYHHLDNSSIGAIYSKPNGVLWVGTFREGINRINLKSETFIHLQHIPGNLNSLSDNNVFFIHRHQSGTLWIGTANGLNKYNPETQTFKVYFKASEGKTPGRVISIWEDQSGILWVGTLGGGLIKFNPFSETSKHYGLKEGLLNNVLNGILQDDNGNLWLSTNEGLFKMDGKTERFDRYDERDGLQSNEFNVGAYHKGYSGRLYFGGINGVTAFYAHQVKNNSHIPPVVMTSFRELNREKNLTPPISEIDQLKLSYKQDVFSLEFAALDFAAPEKNRYLYKLEGFNRNWILANSTQRISTYTNLDPGVYTFKVKASNNHGVWNETPSCLKILITPPFWRTTWFKLLMVLLITLGIFFIYKVRVRSIQTQKKRLEQMVNERTEALKAANDQAERERKAAEDANRSKGDFLARMSHEIRTPMNSIIGFTDMLLETSLDEMQYDYVHTISRSGEALLMLINDILDFSKVEAGLLTLESIPFDPEEVAYDACKMIHHRIGEKQVELLYQIGDKVPLRVKGDPGRFRQVLVNLLGNAVKFTEVGEIELSIAVDKEDADSVTLHTMVKDTGIGIPQDKMDLIFEIFQQVDGSITRKFGGSGLGLAICKQISKLMKGDIWVGSVLKQGSTFHFTAVMKKAEEEQKEKAASKILMGKKVLIVDDNQHNLDILAHTLERAGLNVTGLTQPHEVVPTLKKAFESKDPFHLCILDIQMPDMSGYEVAKQIRSLPTPISSTPLLAFPSSTAVRSKLYQDFGFDAFLPKPARRRELLNMIEQLLDQRKDKKEKEEEVILIPSRVPGEELEPACVLLVEDNPVNRKLAVFILTQAGYQLEVAENGKEAVEKFIRTPAKFDLILMDLQMPEIGGIEAVKIIREKGFTRIPVIAMTAQSMTGDREKCLRAGMNDYVSKPIRKESFLKTVKKWTNIENEELN